MSVFDNDMFTSCCEEYLGMPLRQKACLLRLNLMTCGTFYYIHWI